MLHERPAPIDEAVRRLTASVAHGVGNSLASVRTYAQLVADHLEDTELGKRCAERIVSDSRRIEAMIGTLARLGSLPAPVRRPVDVSAMFAGLLANEHAQMDQRQLVVHGDLERAQPFALGDADQLTFAFELLLGEAIAWSPDGGELQVAVRHQQAVGTAAALLRITLRFPGTPAAIVVFAENGRGAVTAEAVVRAHGGSFSVGAREGNGEVIVDLPTSVPVRVSECRHRLDQASHRAP